METHTPPTMMPLQSPAPNPRPAISALAPLCPIPPLTLPAAHIAPPVNIVDANPVPPNIPVAEENVPLVDHIAQNSPLSSTTSQPHPAPQSIQDQSHSHPDLQNIVLVPTDVTHPVPPPPGSHAPDDVVRYAQHRASLVLQGYNGSDV